MSNRASRCSDTRDQIESPCVSVCEIDQSSGLCRGCFRTLEEIAEWTQYSDAERDRIISELDGRSANLVHDGGSAS